MRKTLTLVLLTTILLNIIFPCINTFATSKDYVGLRSIDYYKALNPRDKYHIPDHVPPKSSNGYGFNDRYWLSDRYRLIVYGDVSDVPGNERRPSEKDGIPEYRYLGYDEAGNKFSNNLFPDDPADPNDLDVRKPLAERNWIYEPWKVLGFDPTNYSENINCKPDIDRIAEVPPVGEGWSPGNGGVFFGYGNVQSYPTLTAPGSLRMWRYTSTGGIRYDTRDIPVLEKRQLNTPFHVTTQVLSSDFTIDEDENTVTVDVKVTAKLDDEEYMTDDVNRVTHYTRDDIEGWWIKLSYKNKEEYVWIGSNGGNTAYKQFKVMLDRSSLVDGERVIFNGIGRVKFKNQVTYVDNDPVEKVFTVVKTVRLLPPDISINAPATVNIKTAYEVAVNPIVPQGETIISLVLEKSVNGGEFVPVPLSDNKATETYASEGVVNYRTVICISNGKTATATATTTIVDNRSGSAKADIYLPQHITYEGVYINAFNRNRFTFDGIEYNAQDAALAGVGTSIFNVYDNSQYWLESSLYNISSIDHNVSMSISFNEPGVYKLGCEAVPKNADYSVEDVESVTVRSCPYIIAQLTGTLKDDRKITLDFSEVVTRPGYPLNNSRTYVKIEDLASGESVTVTNSSHPDSEHIKTNALLGNKLDFLIKTNVDNEYKATIYVEDTRGKHCTRELVFTVVKDKPPVGHIIAKSQVLRNPDSSNNAEIILCDDSYSEDGDYVTRNWTVAIDTDRDESFSDETYVDPGTLPGFEDMSGDGSRRKIKFLKSGVGKISARLKVKEIFGQPTIEAFVTSSDRLETTTSKDVDVINVAPVVDFKMFEHTETTISFIVGSLSDAMQDSLMDSLADFQADLVSARINPAINLVERNLNTLRPVWNQYGGNAQNTSLSPFNGILNTDIKWIYTMDSEADYNIGLYITPGGNVLAVMKEQVYLVGKNGALIRSIVIPCSSGETVDGRGTLVLSDGRIIIPKTMRSGGRYTSRLIVYDSNLNEVDEVFFGNYMYVHDLRVDTGNRIFALIEDDAATNTYYLYVLNPDLSVRACKTVPYSSRGPSSLIVDNGGNMYISKDHTLIKYDIDGNELWSVSGCNSPLLYDEGEGCIYTTSSTTSKTIIKINAATGAEIKRKTYTFYDIGKTSMSATHLYVSDSDLRVRKIRKSDLAEDGYYTNGDGPEKAVLAANGQVFLYSSTDAFSRVTGAGIDEQLIMIKGKDVGYFDAIYSSDNTLYVIGRYVDRWGSHGQAIYGGNAFIAAYGTAGKEQNIDNTLRKIRDNVPSSSGTDFVVSVTDMRYQDNAEADVTQTANLINAMGDRFVLIGNGDSKADGQRILNKGVGGTLFDLSADMSIPLELLKNYIISLLGSPSDRVYSYYYTKNDIVNYDVFYSDYEGDPSKAGYWRYYHTPSSDGQIPNNGVWLASPITQFTKSGVYRVQHYQVDSTGFAAYDKSSNIKEIVIHVETDEQELPPEPPGESFAPVGSIQLHGSQKQNRRLTLKLVYSNGNPFPLDPESVRWTLTPISGMAAGDIKYVSLAGESIDTLYKKPGTVRASVVFSDVAGNMGFAELDIPIQQDVPIAGSITAPSVIYRDSSGKAALNVSNSIASPDDYIQCLNYYLLYDSDNDGSFADETAAELTPFKDKYVLDMAIDSGVGNYMLRCEAKEGFIEDTIHQFVNDGDYSSLVIEHCFTVDNIQPVCDMRTEKDVYLVGETIRYVSNITGSYINSDLSKAFFDLENDAISGFTVKYTQDKTIMPNPDTPSMYHDVLLDSLLASIDRAGKYTIEVSAYDDPKPGDARFDSFKRPSGTVLNPIIVHRLPVAEISFDSSHPSAPIWAFGHNIYLEGTRLRVWDASYDPDGYPVTSIISYKTGNGDYAVINPGDFLDLQYGENVTVKVVTEDNWGAKDESLYTIAAVNDLDMLPQVIPDPVAASELITLRLITNQYATSARAVVFDSNVPLDLVSETETKIVWEGSLTVPDTKPDGMYTAEFYATSEGLAEIRKDKTFNVLTPINLVPDMPDELTAGAEYEIRATTTRYANAVSVKLYKDTAYETIFDMAVVSVPGSENKTWGVDYIVPETVPDGEYTAEFTAMAPNGNRQIETISFSVRTLKITGVFIEGYWNHWRGQVDMFGNRMTVEPHRFLSLETVKITVNTTGYADKVVIRFSPELESMQYTDPYGNTYDYMDDFDLEYVRFPEDTTFFLDASKPDNSICWEYQLPLAPSTKSWENERERPPYWMEATAYRGNASVTYIIDDIDITGNIYDLTYIQPIR